MTDARYMELNKIANEIFNENMVRELKEGYDKFPPASRRLAQTIFPTDGAARLLEGCSIWVAAATHLGSGRCRAAVAGGSGDPQLSVADFRTLRRLLGPKGEGPGCKRRFLSRVHGDPMHLSGDERMLYM